jgi:hypothetical protein
MTMSSPVREGSKSFKRIQPHHRDESRRRESDVKLPAHIFHLAEEANVRSIQQQGLLSTSMAKNALSSNDSSVRYISAYRTACTFVINNRCLRTR